MGRGTDLVVGRGPELDLLDGLLAQTSAGGARAVFVTGEPGIGKTHVLRELVRRAERRGCLVLEGSAAEYEQELPFGVVIDALDAYVASLGRNAVDRLAADGLEELADVFPSLHGLRSSADRPPTAAERFRSYYAVRELLERLAGKQPLVLVLDDLHWSDGASMELVAYLLRRPPDAPMLLAGSFRTGQAGRALAVAIEAADRSGEVERLDLGPLAREEAGRLLPTADRPTRERLYAQSGGNPFYLLQLARARVHGAGVRVRTADDGDIAPPAVAAAIAQELAGLSAGARSFAEAAAVVGDPFDLDVAALAADVTESTALAWLDELIARDLLRPAPVPRRFQFRHPLVRSAIYGASSMSTRLAAHSQCAVALAKRGAPATARARHVEQSARHGDYDAILVLMEAAQANAQRLPSSAARWYEAALRILPESAPADERVDLLMATATALTTAGRLKEARAAVLQALALVPTDAIEKRVRLTAVCAGIEQQLGHHQESHGRLLAALDELTDRNSEAGVSLMVALATDGFYQVRYDQMVEWGLGALAASSGLGDRSLTAAAEAVLALGYAFTGATDEANGHRLAAARIVDAMTDDELTIRRDALGHLAAAELYLERFEETAAHARRGIEMARAAGEGNFFPTLFPCLGTATWVLGRLAESIEVLDGAVESARLAGNAQAVAWGLLNLSLSALMGGDWELAMTTAEESARVAEGLSDSFVRSFVGVVHGLVLFETGDPARGAEVMLVAGGGEELANMPGGWRADHLQGLCRCFLALGRLDDARRAAERSRAVAELVRLPRSDATSHRAAAAVALYAGDAAVAVAEARASVAAADGNSALVDAAMARILLGRALALAGDVDLAAAELERAAADFESYGAPRYRDQAEQELRKLGHHISRRSTAGKTGAGGAGAGGSGGSGGGGLEALSGRELEVARLVLDRRTNPEIAADLFLSLKTVESHMRNIFRKLGVSSRVEVARTLERSARADTP
jgi:DNA-binding NarL/FixJ family response regulator